jgi:hypothetical protein
MQIKIVVVANGGKEVRSGQGAGKRKCSVDAKQQQWKSKACKDGRKARRKVQNKVNRGRNASKTTAPKKTLVLVIEKERKMVTRSCCPGVGMGRTVAESVTPAGSGTAGLLLMKSALVAAAGA